MRALRQSLIFFIVAFCVAWSCFWVWRVRELEAQTQHESTMPDYGRIALDRKSQTGGYPFFVRAEYGKWKIWQTPGWALDLPFTRFEQKTVNFPFGARLESVGQFSITAPLVAGIPLIISGHDLHLSAERTVMSHIMAEDSSAQPIWYGTASARNIAPNYAISLTNTLTIDWRLLGSVAGLTTPALETWHKSGGTLELTQLEWVQGPMRLLASGTLSLDKELQPEVALTAQITGFQEALQQTESEGKINSAFAGLLRMGLLAFSKPDEKGVQTVTAPLSVQNRKLYIGPIAVLTFEKIHWQWY